MINVPLSEQAYPTPEQVAIYRLNANRLLASGMGWVSIHPAGMLALLDALEVKPSPTATHRETAEYLLENFMTPGKSVDATVDAIAQALTDAVAREREEIARFIDEYPAAAVTTLAAAIRARKP